MRLERITPTLEEWCSIQLSYGSILQMYEMFIDYASKVSLLSDSNWRVQTELGYKSSAIDHYAKKAYIFL